MDNPELKCEVEYGALIEVPHDQIPDNVPNDRMILKREITVREHQDCGIVTSLITEYICRRDVHVIHPGLSLNSTQGRLN